MPLTHQDSWPPGFNQSHLALLSSPHCLWGWDNSEGNSPVMLSDLFRRDRMITLEQKGRTERERGGCSLLWFQWGSYKLVMWQGGVETQNRQKLLREALALLNSGNTSDLPQQAASPVSRCVFKTPWDKHSNNPLCNPVQPDNCCTMIEHWPSTQSVPHTTYVLFLLLLLLRLICLWPATVEEPQFTHKPSVLKTSELSLLPILSTPTNNFTREEAENDWYCSSYRPLSPAPLI